MSPGSEGARDPAKLAVVSDQLNSEKDHEVAFVLKRMDAFQIRLYTPEICTVVTDHPKPGIRSLAVRELSRGFTEIGDPIERADWSNFVRPALRRCFERGDFGPRSSVLNCAAEARDRELFDLFDIAINGTDGGLVLVACRGLVKLADPRGVGLLLAAKSRAKKRRHRWLVDMYLDDLKSAQPLPGQPNPE